MKKIFVVVSILATSLFANAQDLLCVDAKTGLDAGQLSTLSEDGYGNIEVIFYSSKDATDGWLLRINADGEIYNNDEMVQGGLPVRVGTLEIEAFSPIKLTLESRPTMHCQ